MQLVDPRTSYCRLRDESRDVPRAPPFSPTNWSSLVALAQSESVCVDLLDLIEKRSLSDQLPADLLSRLVAFQWAAEESERRLRVLVRHIARLLESNEIDFVLLKGSAIICGDYGAAKGHRTINDIDILVKPGQLDKITQILLSNGFETELVLPDKLDEFWSSKHLPPFFHPDFNFPLEIHQLPLSTTGAAREPNLLSATEVFERSEVVVIDGSKVQIPCAEHMFFHAFYHSQISDLYDLECHDNYRAMIDCVLIVDKRSNSFDWNLLNSLAIDKRLRNALSLFIERISACVDQRAAQWPSVSARPAINRFRWWLVSKSPWVGRLMSVTVLHVREMRRALSQDGRNERQQLLRSNPDSWKYYPLWRQLTSLTLMISRWKYFLGKLRS